MKERLKQVRQVLLTIYKQDLRDFEYNGEVIHAEIPIGEPLICGATDENMREFINLIDLDSIEELEGCSLDIPIVVRQCFLSFLRIAKRIKDVNIESENYENFGFYVLRKDTILDMLDLVEFLQGLCTNPNSCNYCKGKSQIKIFTKDYINTSYYEV